jgi:hypothetical protein
LVSVVASDMIFSFFRVPAPLIGALHARPGRGR